MKTIFKQILILNSVFLFCSLSIVKAQNIGINGTGANAHPSALLDIDAVATPSLGLLIPRIALQAINLAAPVTSPATSLLVYNTASASTGTNAVSAGYYYWDGTKWVRFAYSASGSSSTAWDLLGNGGTSSTTNFLGTTDAQDLVFKTNNTEKMRVLSNGNVGIGFNNPAAPLEVWGAGIPIAIVSTNSNATKGILSDNGISRGYFGADINRQFFTGDGASVGQQFNILQNGNVGIGTTTPVCLLHATTTQSIGAAIEYVNSAGSLSAGYGLNIVNNSTTPNTFSSLWFNDAGVGSGVAAIGAKITDHTTGSRNSDLEFLTLNNEAASTKMIIKDDGKVGIGVLTPTAGLHVGSTHYPSYALFGYLDDIQRGSVHVRGGEDESSTRVNKQATMYLFNGFGTSTTLHIREDFASSSHFGLFVGNQNKTQAALMTVGERVGIGTIAPNTKLNVVDNTSGVFAVNISQNSATGSGLSVVSAGGGGFSAINGNCTGVGGAGTIGQAANGYGLYGTTSSATYAGVFGVSSNNAIWGKLGDQGLWAFYGSGDSYTTGTYSSSDVRWKSNVKTITNSLDIVNKLRGVYYNYNDTYPALVTNKGRQIGVIAQEVQQVLPELVREVDKEGHLAVAYDKIIPVLIEAIKELNIKNEKLEKEIEVLKKKQ